MKFGAFTCYMCARDNLNRLPLLLGELGLSVTTQGEACELRRHEISVASIDREPERTGPSLFGVRKNEKAPPHPPQTSPIWPIFRRNEALSLTTPDHPNPPQSTPFQSQNPPGAVGICRLYAPDGRFRGGLAGQKWESPGVFPWKTGPNPVRSH